MVTVVSTVPFVDVFTLTTPSPWDRSASFLDPLVASVPAAVEVVVTAAEMKEEAGTVSWAEMSVEEERDVKLALAPVAAALAAESVEDTAAELAVLIFEESSCLSLRRCEEGGGRPWVEKELLRIGMAEDDEGRRTRRMEARKRRRIVDRWRKDMVQREGTTCVLAFNCGRVRVEEGRRGEGRGKRRGVQPR